MNNKYISFLGQLKKELGELKNEKWNKLFAENFKKVDNDKVEGEIMEQEIKAISRKLLSFIDSMVRKKEYDSEAISYKGKEAVAFVVDTLNKNIAEAR